MTNLAIETNNLVRSFRFVMPLIAALAVISLSIGQTHAVPHFEVASVKAHKAQGGDSTRQVSPTTITYLNVKKKPRRAATS